MATLSIGYAASRKSIAVRPYPAGSADIFAIKASGAFRAEKDYAKLVAASLPLLKRSGVLFASTNAAAWPARNFSIVWKQRFAQLPEKLCSATTHPNRPISGLSHGTGVFEDCVVAN